MDVLWADTGWMTPAEVHEALPMGPTIGYTTVMTTLARLWKKGRLERRKDGRAFAYHPTASRSEWTAIRMDQVMRLNGERAATLANFVERLDKADRIQLRRMLLDGNER